MRIKKIPFILFMGLMLGLLPMNAQNCSDLYKRANSLKSSKKYAEAISYYQQAKECDPNLKSDCNKWIEYCKKRLPFLEISESEIRIPYQGGDREIEVKSNERWKINLNSDWCKTNAYDTKNFIVQCREANNGTREKVTNLFVTSGTLFKSIKVIQEGRPEYIEVSAESLSFPAKGTSDDVKIESNANWDVKSVPTWCEIKKNSDGIHIVVSPNDRVMERTDDIVIESPSKSVIIKIFQGAGEEHLTLSQNNLVLNSEGDVHYMRVYTDANNWFIGDYPTWLNVQRIGNDSIRIECGKNIPNGEPRSGSVQIKTDRQTAGVMITQTPRKAQDLIFPNSKLVGGRNLSFGFAASYIAPFISTSAGSECVGSVVDYGLGTSDENASYSSALGYKFGVFADLRLYKNIFLVAGVDFMQIKYKNKFNENTIFTKAHGDREYLKGEVQNSYEEEYTHTMIEIPIMASYRFKINDVSHIQLNCGPVINLGLSSKIKLSGNTHGETLQKYYMSNNQLVDNGRYTVHYAVDSEFNLYQPCVLWEREYTIGNDASTKHHDVFHKAPFSKVNYGLRLGVAYEWAGLSIGLNYTYMLSNMAQKEYWNNERWTVLNNADAAMKGYKHRINTLEFKLSYSLRYL